MIPIEVAEIASLIWPGWEHLDDTGADIEARVAKEEILGGAWRIYNAGFRKRLLTPA